MGLSLGVAPVAAHAQDQGQGDKMQSHDKMHGNKASKKDKKEEKRNQSGKMNKMDDGKMSESK